mgnify:CR=1 FL=1
MGWNYGYKNLGGLCDTGKIFGAYTDVSTYNLRYDPFYDSDRFRPISKGVAGNDGLGGTLGGLNLGDFRILQDQTNYVVYRIDVVSDDDIHREIVLKGQYRQQYTDFVCQLYLRVYSDATTYTDTEFTAYNAGSMVTGWYPSGGFNEVTQAVYAVFTTIQHDGVRYMLVGLCNEYKVPWQQDQIKYAISCIGIPVDVFTTWLDGGSVEPVEESPEFGPASEPDGYGYGGVPGTHDKHSDHVGIPTKPQFGFTSAGFLNHYRISALGLSMLGEALFPEPQGPSADVLGAIDRLTANMWNSKIIDYIIDCRIIPVTAPATNQVNITCGGKVLVHPGTGAAYSAYLVDEDFVDVDCGTITTGLTEGNFIDFSVTRAKIFVPFYGYVDLAPEYWHGAKIGLYYRFNLMDGSFMAWLTSAPFRAELENASDMEIIGQYAGNACIHLPINSQSYSQIIGGMITTGAAIVGAAAGGAIGGAAGKTIAAGAVQTAISGAANIANGRPQLISNNSYNGSAALMSNRTPYLLIEFGEAQFSTKYTDECGLPLVVNKLIGDCSGMTVCDNAIINFACTDAEAKEILAALREGVIV